MHENKLVVVVVVMCFTEVRFQYQRICKVAKHAARLFLTIWPVWSLELCRLQMCSMGFFNNRSGNSFIFILFASNNNECVVIVKTTNSTATKIQTDALPLKQRRCVDYILGFKQK